MLTIKLSSVVLALLPHPPLSPHQGPTDKSTKSLTDSPRPDPDGVYRVGNGVSVPKPLSMPDPEFSEKARKKKIGGNCTVSLIVNVDGSVKDVKVTHSIAEGHPKSSEPQQNPWIRRPSKPSANIASSQVCAMESPSPSQ